ncbi:pentapeptide repeat-containing protein [Streptomyces sp. NPDC005407]|uniref:pentapeptide repeat-containing protein n=1 Tax=Streptomyces sp. NPDC005407 TaxID=3155340 RepID=UPI0033A9F395
MLVLAVATSWILLFWLGPAVVDEAAWHRLGPADRAVAAANWRSLLVQIGLGTGALGALIFTARNFLLAREGQVVDRFTKAVDQISSDRVDVRLGGIFALERVMVDSPRDHETVVLLLCAFLGERAPADHDSSEPWSSDIEWLEPPSLTNANRITNWRPPADIRAALTVLARRPRRPETDRLDLSSTDLRGATLADYGRLSGATLSGADLRQTDFSRADMRHAALAKADARQGFFVSTDLRGALLYNADLRGALLMGADLSHADLSKVRLEGALLDHVRFHGANLNGANLRDTDLRRVNGLTTEQLSQAETNAGTQVPGQGI